MKWLTLNNTRLVTWRGPHNIVGEPGVRNMYGCLPCPRCGDGYRAAFFSERYRGKWPRSKYVIVCGGCGRRQAAVFEGQCDAL